ncbi:unnamed protein product, partial [Prunus brigantina]
TTQEDIVLCECWVKVSHCPITGNEMKFAHMWSKIHGEFCERSGSIRTEMAVFGRWKILNKEFGKWRYALTKQIAKNGALRIERDLKREEVDKTQHEAFAIERQHAQEQDMEDREMKIMAMDTSHMSLETKSYWKLKRRDVMRRKLFHDDGPSNMDWLNDQN